MATLGGNRVVEGSQNSIEIQNLARFALEEHNKNSNSSLELVRVISAKEQVVAGSIYEITMEAKDGDEKKQVYEAKVLVKPWLNFKELQEFKLVTDDDNEKGKYEEPMEYLYNVYNGSLKSIRDIIISVTFSHQLKLLR